MWALGFDTSNYTTSVALTDGHARRMQGRLLDVPSGALGLRQSDALFLHTKRLPELSEALFDGFDQPLAVIGASTRPRAVEGSYMPCFLAGEAQARTLAAALHVPFCPVSHQEGHLAAVLHDAGRMDLIDRPFLCWHLSGGTTELLRVTPCGWSVHAERIGGTMDLSAGQLIDRTGKLLGLDFPAGKALDALAQQGEGRPYPVRLHGLEFSLSGMQNQVEQLQKRGASAAQIAYFAISSVCHAVDQASRAALKLYPGEPVVFSGGVSSNATLRAWPCGYERIFAAPAVSTDNALGVAVLAHRWRECIG